MSGRDEAFHAFDRKKWRIGFEVLKGRGFSRAVSCEVDRALAPEGMYETEERERHQ